MINFCYVNWRRHWNWNWMTIDEIGIEKKEFKRIELKEMDLVLNKRSSNDLKRELELNEWN